MPIWLIIVLSVIAVDVIAGCIIHRHVINAAIKKKPRGKAPKWHVWLPKKMRVE